MIAMTMMVVVAVGCCGGYISSAAMGCDGVSRRRADGSGQNQGEWDQLSVLHNYSCPVARVMVCIGAAAVVRREPSGAERRTARLLGLMMESLAWLPLRTLSLSLSLSGSLSRCCMQLV